MAPATHRRGGRGSVRPVDSSDNLVCLEVPGEGACLKAALRLLNARDIPARVVVAVDPFAVTWLDRRGCVWTAWTYRESVGGKERVSVWAEPGLPAFPTVGP